MADETDKDSKQLTDDAMKAIDRLGSEINAVAPAHTGGLVAAAIVRELIRLGMSDSTKRALVASAPGAKTADTAAIIVAKIIAHEVAESMSALSRTREVLTSAESARDAAKTHADAAANAERIASEKAAHLSYAHFLASERKSHVTRGGKLVCLIVGLIVGWSVLGVVSACTLHSSIESYDPHQWWVPLIGRAVALATLGGVVVFVMKLYQAERHNEIVYAQKLAALDTFKAFSDQADRQDDAKVAILAHAMATIFASHDTGYARNANAESAMPSEIVLKLLKPATSKVADATTKVVATP